MTNTKIVYALLDPRKPGLYNYGTYTFDFEPFYIGEGEPTRPQDHIAEAKNSKDQTIHKLNKIRKINSTSGLSPIVSIIKDNLTKEEACKLEIELISLIGRNDIDSNFPLTNRSPGGDRPPLRYGDDNWARKVALTGNHPNRLRPRKIPIVKTHKNHWIAIPWQHHNATKASKLGWYLKNEICAIAKNNPVLGRRMLSLTTNRQLNLLNTYGIELDNNLPDRIVNYKYWTEEKQQLWENWKSSYDPFP